MATGQCNARQIQLADPATRQGTGLNACGGQGTKGTKLCDRNLERGDGSRVALLHAYEDVASDRRACGLRDVLSRADRTTTPNRASLDATIEEKLALVH